MPENRLYGNAILPPFQWLNLPREMSDRVRREFCCNGKDSGEYREAVHAARAFWGYE